MLLLLKTKCQFNHISNFNYSMAAVEKVHAGFSPEGWYFAFDPATSVVSEIHVDL